MKRLENGNFEITAIEIMTSLRLIEDGCVDKNDEHFMGELEGMLSAFDTNKSTEVKDGKR